MFQTDSYYNILFTLELNKSSNLYIFLKNLRDLKTVEIKLISPLTVVVVVAATTAAAAAVSVEAPSAPPHAAAAPSPAPGATLLLQVLLGKRLLHLTLVVVDLMVLDH